MAKAETITVTIPPPMQENYVYLAKRGVEGLRTLRPRSLDWREGVKLRANAQRARDLRYEDIIENLRSGLDGIADVIEEVDYKSVAIGAGLAIALLVLVKKMKLDRKLMLNRIGL